MPVDSSLVGRSFPPTPPYDVTEGKVREFNRATGSDGDAVPPTFPIVLSFDALFAFLEAEQIDLFRIVHGEQRFAYERPIEVGDTLTATLTVSSLRQIGGADIIGTTSEITDPSGTLVCTAKATVIHSGAAS
jgi:acyl dehydratase